MQEDERVPLADMVSYLQVFSILIESGVSLMRSMHVLDQTITYEPLKVANRDLMAQVEGGETLSKSMCAHAQLFSPFLIGLVRAGEVGGVLDETLRRAADFYQKQLDYRRERQVLNGTAMALGEKQSQQYEAALAATADDVQIQYFCYMLGTMLLSGVPILQALEVAAQVLPERQAEGVEVARQALRDGESLSPPLLASGFPAAVVTLFHIGEETRNLDRLVLRAGDVLGAQIQGQLQAALDLN